MHKFDIGDKVKVRGDLEVNKKYGKYVFSEAMENYKNKIVIINSIHYEYYCVKGNFFPWTEEMFEPINKVITNWDKVKEGVKEALEKIDLGNLENDSMFCPIIHAIRGEGNCWDRSCIKCKKWLKQPCKEPSILDDVEKEYLSAVIKPFRNKIAYIIKRGLGDNEYIGITVNALHQECITFPNFKTNTMYKGMKIGKRYTLKDLDL